MTKLWNNTEKPLLGLPTTWFYAEADDGRFLFVPIGGGEMRLSDSLDGGCDLCNKKAAQQYIRNYRRITKDNKTKFTIKSTVVLI